MTNVGNPGFSDQEREKFTQLLSAGFTDSFRCLYPDKRDAYSWWSYRAADWAASNRGRRLDHVWATPALAPTARALTVLREARGWERPSDHVPVIATFDA